MLHRARIDCDEKVGGRNVCAAKHLDGGRTAVDGTDVGDAGDALEPLVVIVDDGHVVVRVAEHLGQMGADFSGAYDNDLHTNAFLL